METNPYYLKDTEGDYYNEYPEFQIWEDGKQAGIKEVVAWMSENITWDWPNDELLFSSWLKERGL